MKNFTFIAVFTLLVILLPGKFASAATKITTQSGNWSAAGTWGGNPAPVKGDDVIINGGSTVTVDIPNAICSSVQLGGSVAGTGIGTLQFSASSQLTVEGAVSIGPVNDKTTEGSFSMANGGTLICQRIAVGRLGTWTTGTGNIELTATNTIPNDNNVIFYNLTISGGTTSLPGNVDVKGNLTINPTAILNGGANTLTVSGNWTNNGTFTGNTGTVIFVKNGNQAIAGTGVNNFNLIKVNLGTNISNTLEVTATNFSAPDAFLTITNGTFKVSGNFTLASTFFAGPSYNIQPTSGLWINNPNVTITAQTGSASVKGLLRLTAGTINIGTDIDNSLDYVTGSTILVEGGAVNIAGHLSGNNGTATTSYTQTGGTVTVVKQGSTSPAFAGFDLKSVGSTFTMSGGTIVISNASGAASEYIISASVASVTGGTLQIGDASTGNAQNFRIQSSRPIGNLLISDATTQATKPSVQLISSGLTVLGNVTIDSGTALNANGLPISLGGNWTDNGTFTHGGNTVTFDGAGAQSLAAADGETFNNLVIGKTGGTLSVNSQVNVNNTFNLSQGTIAIGTNLIILDGTVSGGGTLTSSANGTVNYNQGSSGQNVLTGNYGNLIFSNFDKILPSSGLIGVAGTFDPGTATGHSITGSTINFNGGSQVIPAFAYNNITMSSNGIKTGSGIISVAGNLTNNSGIEFSGTSTLALNGPAHINNGTLSSSTLSIGPGSTLSNNGTLSSISALTGAGSIVQGTAAVFNIGGTSGNILLNAVSAGNEVNYSGTGQTVLPTSYHHLTLSGSGSGILTGVSTINGNFTISGSVTATAASTMNIGGDFSISSGSSFDAGSFSHSLKGNCNNSGTFNEGSSTFLLNGTSPQTLSGSAFNNLSVANAAGVTLLTDETVNGALALTSGTFSIGSHTLNLNGKLSIGTGTLLGGTNSDLVIGGTGASITLPGITLNSLTLDRANGSSLSGDIVINNTLTITNGILSTGNHTVTLGSDGILSEAAGQLLVGNITTTRNVISTSGTASFGNIGAEILLNGVAPGNTTVSRKTGTASTGKGHTSILRYFDITPATNTGLNAGLVFHYDLTELNGQDENLLELYRSGNNGATWNNMGGSVDKALGTITVTGINNFSQWTAADLSNSIGATATPAIASISTNSRTAGDPGFSLTVNGSNFVNGKSTILFDGVSVATTYVNTNQLVGVIPSNLLAVSRTLQVTVFNSPDGGSSNGIAFIVNPLPVKVVVETAVDGSGTLVPEQSLTTGTPITVYAIARDASDNFVANVAADIWSLQIISGSLTNTDLVPASDGKSAVLMSHFTGTATINATSGTLSTLSSGIITIFSATGINEGELSQSYALMQNYPNPFIQSTSISFQIPKQSKVVLKVYDAHGIEVETLVNETEEAGLKTVTLNAGSLANGTYYYRLVAGNYTETRKFLLLR